MESFVISATDERIEFLKKKDKRLGKVIDEIGPIECTVHSDPFEFIVSQIVGQMLSNKVAHIIFNRLKLLCEDDICTTKLLNLGRKNLNKLVYQTQSANILSVCRWQYKKKQYVWKNY